MSAGIIKRRVTREISARMAEVPVIALQGPRSVGKSTVLNEIAKRTGATVLNLDDRATRQAVAEDPTRFIERPGRIFIDEYQRVPDVLDAIKADVDANYQPGRFLLTGSTRFDALPITAQALTGRIHFMTILPFSQGEIAGAEEDFVDVSLTDPERLLTGPAQRLTREEYAERICAGGMPIALRSTPTARHRWFDDYATASVRRDVAALSNIRRGSELPKLFARLAGQTAQVLNISEAARATGLDNTTANSYTTLLEDLFLIQRLPAWGRTLRSRSTALPKVHVVDSGLAARLLRITPERLVRLDPASLVEFGHLLETFTIGELTKQASWNDQAATLGHWRTHDGHEVDFILEAPDGAVTGFEVKAARGIQRKDIKGLIALRDALGDQFHAGFILNTGDLAYRIADRIYVVPIDHIWRPAPALKN